MADDPFSNAHRAAERKATVDAAKKAHETMVERATAKGALAGKPKPQPKPYVPAGPWWR